METVENSTVPTSPSSSYPSATPVKIITGLLVVGLVFFCVLLAFLILRHRRIISIVIKTFPRDIKGIVRFVKTFKGLRGYERAGCSVGSVFDKVVASHPTKTCFKAVGQQWTFLEVWEMSNRIGNYFLQQGYAQGDVVALFMENRPEYVCIWLGLSRIGVVTSLINSNLKCQPLRHSIDVAKPKAVIYGEELTSTLAEVLKPELTSGTLMPLFKVGSDIKELTVFPQVTDFSLQDHVRTLDESSKILEKEVKSALKTRPSTSDHIKFSDPLFYIYTSGTTGLPKAAIIKHSRFMMGAISFHHMNNLRNDDIIYTCLPLYHTAGGLCGVGQSLFWGNTVVLSKKFSASRFWTDCIQNNVTVAQYIGETCRYLLSQPSTPEERQHRIRVMVGNGLRPEIWKEFIRRFNIQQVSEIYGSTDGNCNMVNFDNRVGAVGFVPILLHKLYPMGIVKVDEITGEALRDDQTGLAIRCKPNEPGELVGKIVANHPIREFQGYAGEDSKSSTEKKILRDVFVKGDSAFRTGDYLVMDEFGYFYFRDRAGDTYRWKGENISTAEVEAVIGTICDLKDCVVYGVKIPGTDGKAGMCAIADPDFQLNLDSFADGVYKALPSYARPLFIRVSKEIESTGTHKMKKFELQNEGFDVTKISDPIYFYTNGKYVQLDEDLYHKIVGCKIRI